MNKSRKSFFTAKNVAYLGVLTALVVVLQLWGSLIPIGSSGLNLSFVLLPITLGGMLLGPLAGMFLGFVFGLIVLITGICGWSFFTYYLFSQNPFMTVLICLLKGIVCGFAGGIVFRLLKRFSKLGAAFAAAAAVPIFNTGIFILGTLCISGTVRDFAFLYMDLSSDNIMYIIIVGLVTFNFVIELAINLVCSPALYTVDRVVEKQLNRESKKRKANAVKSDEGADA